MMSTWLSTGRFQVIFADNRPHVALKISEALYVSEILHWFVEEEGLLLGEELNKTYNVARDPVLICLEGGLTPELKDKLPERLCNKPHFFLYFVVRQYFQFKSLGHFNILPYFLTRQHHVHLIKQCICKPKVIIVEVTVSFLNILVLDLVFYIPVWFDRPTFCSQTAGSDRLLIVIAHQGGVIAIFTP